MYKYVPANDLQYECFILFLNTPFSCFGYFVCHLLSLTSLSSDMKRGVDGKAAASKPAS